MGDELVVRTLKEKMAEKNIPLVVEPLTKFDGVMLIVREFKIEPSALKEDLFFAVMDVVTPDGVRHIVTCGGQTVLRALVALDPAVDFPLQATFKLGKSGQGRKVWTIE